MTELEAAQEQPVEVPEHHDLTRRARPGTAKLRKLLWGLQRNKRMRDRLDRERKEMTAEAAAILRKGSAMVIDPSTGRPKLAAVRRDQEVRCDAGELLQALVEYNRDVLGLDSETANANAEAVWADTLKPREVDVRAEDASGKPGRLRQAVKDGRIPAEVVHKVVHLVDKAPWVQFTNPS